MSGAGGSGGAAAGGAAGARKEGLSTGAKLLIGCGILGVLAVVAGAVALTLGGMALKRGVESAVGGFEEQQEASRTLARLREEHPFEPPGNGVVTEAQVERYVAVTDDAWEALQPWADDLARLRRADGAGDGGEPPGIGDLVTGARAMGGLGRSRQVLAETLAEHDVSLGEYAWTGLTLARAMDAVEGGQTPAGTPEANVELARAWADRLPELRDRGTDGPGRGSVLVLATLWGMTEAPTWEALGLDTLGEGVR